jgi:hypothetical protein
MGGLYRTGGNFAWGMVATEGVDRDLQGLKSGYSVASTATTVRPL